MSSVDNGAMDDVDTTTLMAMTMMIHVSVFRCIVLHCDLCFFLLSL